MFPKKPFSSCQAIVNRAAATVIALTLTGCAHMSDAKKIDLQASTPRAQLSIGYSLLYQEADGIPKLKWLLLFKDKPEEMAHVTRELIDYYQGLAETMRTLSKQYPAMHIDVAPMSDIEAAERKSIGEDLAKDLAPVVGKSGIAFEREALLTFYESLNEQRHLTRVMAERETDPGLRRFLEKTESQLQEHYTQVGALLNRRYFTH